MKTKIEHVNSDFRDVALNARYRDKMRAGLEILFRGLGGETR